VTHQPKVSNLSAEGLLGPHSRTCTQRGGARAGSRTLNLGIKSPKVSLAADSQVNSQGGGQRRTKADGHRICKLVLELQRTLTDCHCTRDTRSSKPFAAVKAHVWETGRGVASYSNADGKPRHSAALSEFGPTIWNGVQRSVNRKGAGSPERALDPRAPCSSSCSNPAEIQP
jgi:hypothetical protein